MSDPSLVRFRTVVDGALAHLESRRQEINDLNVFPVADGDTGDNMALTLQAVLTELDRLAADTRSPGGSQGTGGGRLIDEIGRDEIVESVARAALLGARGNSGVILSQLIRGAAEELVSRPGRARRPGPDRRRDGARRAARLRLGAPAGRGHDPDRPARHGDERRHRARAHGRHAAGLRGRPRRPERADRRRARARAARRRGVGAPRPGAAGGPARERRRRRRRPRADGDRRGHDRRAARQRGAGHRRAGARPRQPPAAQLLDAPLLHELRRHRPRPRPGDLDRAARGARRLGARRRRRGDAQDPRPHRRARGRDRAVSATPARSRTSTSPTCTRRCSRARTGWPRHRRRPASRRRPSSAAARSRSSRAPACASSTRASGWPCSTPLAGRTRSPGLAGHRQGIGGGTLNPSTFELLAGIHGVHAQEVVVLPNSPNVVMAAAHAAELSEKVVEVSAARSQQAGLSAALALDPARSAADNVAAIDAALAHVRTGAVAPAARADGEGRFAVGDAVGFVDDAIVAWGEPESTLRAVLDDLASGAELLTLIAGEGAPLDEAARARAGPGRRRARVRGRRAAELLVAGGGRVARAFAPGVRPASGRSGHEGRRCRSPRVNPDPTVVPYLDARQIAVRLPRSHRRRVVDGAARTSIGRRGRRARARRRSGRSLDRRRGARR